MSLRRTFALATGLMAVATAQVIAAPDLKSFALPIHDYSSTVTATQVDTDELTKISKDYANTYRIKASQIFYLTPNHIKVAGRIGPISAVYVINGNTKKYKYGPIKRTEDVLNAPGKKQGLIDFGLITADQLEDYTWKFVKQDKVGKSLLYLYELRFKNLKEDPSRRLIWIDPAKKVIVRRQVYHQFRDNVMKMDVRYDGFKPAGAGVWAPTVIRVYNAEGKLGAVSQQSAIRVNKGVSSDAFQL